jgi:hypothetical protein
MYAREQFSAPPPQRSPPSCLPPSLQPCWLLGKLKMGTAGGNSFVFPSPPHFLLGSFLFVDPSLSVKNRATEVGKYFPHPRDEFLNLGAEIFAHILNCKKESEHKKSFASSEKTTHLCAARSTQPHTHNSAAACPTSTGVRAPPSPPPPTLPPPSSPSPLSPRVKQNNISHFLFSAAKTAIIIILSRRVPTSSGVPFHPSPPSQLSSAASHARH